VRATPDLSAQEEDACPTGPCLTARLSQSSPQICWRWLSWTARRWRISLSDEGSPGIKPHELCAPPWESLTARAGWRSVSSRLETSRHSHHLCSVLPGRRESMYQYRNGFVITFHFIDQLQIPPPQS
jgi:hypothetical protein